MNLQFFVLKSLDRDFFTSTLLLTVLFVWIIVFRSKSKPEFGNMSVIRELGEVKWTGAEHFNEALGEAKRQDKLVFLLFQEIPGKFPYADIFM